MTTDINLISFLTFLMMTCLGAFYHWRKMKKEKRVLGTFTDYLFADNPGNSLATGFLLLGASWAAATSGTADLIHPALLYGLLMAGKLHIASFNALGGAFLTGYGFDSLLNKGSS